jgi:hypothetical protein
MNLRLALRRFVVALIGLALMLPAVLPQAVAAPAAAGLPAALSVICSNLTPSATGEEQGGQNTADHQSCQACTGACHGMVLATADAPALTVATWTHDFSVPGDVTNPHRGSLTGYASRAPPLA